MGKKLMATVGLGLSFIYILNPTFGIFEFIPDATPFIGNLDEATATGILIWCAKELFSKKEKQREDILDDKA